MLQCVAMCCSVLQYVKKSRWATLKSETMLQRAAACCSAVQLVAVCYRVFQCVAACCSVLQCHVCVAVCSVAVRVAVSFLCCSVLQCVKKSQWAKLKSESMLQRVAACCSVLQFVAACCGVLKCVEVWCSVL